MKSILLLQGSPTSLMDALVEQTCELAAALPHMESARVLERRVSPQGHVLIRQQWRLRVSVPALLRPHLEDGLQDCVLTFEYRTGESLLQWRAESAALHAPGDVGGSLVFATALGGRGSRVEWNCEVPIANEALRTIIGALLERQWRALLEAAAARVAAARPAAPTG
ncbi:MAG TPA: hypothetical protein VN614_09825 [Rhodanobacter sp.]|jgi:hypothetical protein|nr:hypothetical protein [Rhodanobacter sp.]